MVGAGNGITVTAALAAPEASEHYDLVFISLEKPVVWRSICTVSRRGRKLTKVARDLLGELTILIREKIGDTVRLG
ncbi:MAG: hypothetical protein O2838_08040 [Proteobacteria bacterium]|nr:hypothetical protein [Pseudomonadota bacterium]